MPPAGFASSDVVTMVKGELMTWKLVDNRLVKTGSVMLTGGPETGTGEWADRDHLFIQLDERRVVMVTEHAITEVPIPPESTFAIPKPKGLQNVVPDAGVDMSYLAVTDGEAYWSHCAWGEPFGAFLCKSWVHARLWPSPALLKDQPYLKTRAWTWSAPPAGYSTKAETLSVTCTGPQGTTTIKAAQADGYDKIAGVHWVSTKPPRLLVTFGDDNPFGGVAPWQWTLHDGCAPTSIASGTSVEPGPRGLWIGADRDKPQTIYRGADAIGEAPELTPVWFRPPR